MQPSGSATKGGVSGPGAFAQVEIFQYPADPNAPQLPDWGTWGAGDGGTADPGEQALIDHGRAAAEAGMRAEFDKRLAVEVRKSFEEGRERGNQEGRLAERELQAAALATATEQRTRQGVELIERFMQERDRFLNAVESEVVELALAIAARILRREAQMDPLLLTGAVRVALGQLSNSTSVKLMVPAAELDLWVEAIDHVPNLALKPAVLPGEGMRLGECIIETELGSVDLGIRSQLGEIERGFFDRAGGRRGETSARAAELAGTGPAGRAGYAGQQVRS